HRALRLTLLVKRQKLQLCMWALNPQPLVPPEQPFAAAVPRRLARLPSRTRWSIVTSVVPSTARKPRTLALKVGRALRTAQVTPAASQLPETPAVPEVRTVIGRLIRT